ncbi:uncharacterized protein LOC119197349 isoform X2 [Pungitius pungitius]|uniref:uncharacterized protein LOC119197349 isoform X2 n=1 Tax=Pungitius pungitius TaxID=134920 RepID=UPI002E0E5E15
MKQKIAMAPFSVSEGKGIAAIPGSPDRATALHKRLTKTEADILSLKTRVACERASWERRFAELRRKQEELLNQLACQAGELGRVGRCKESEECGVDNGELFEDCPSGLSGRVYQRRGSEVLSGDVGGPLRGLTGCLYPIPPWTWNWVTGSGSCCRLDGPERERFVSWVTCRGRRTFTSGWSYKHPITDCTVAATRDAATLSASLAVGPLYHSTNY